MAENEVSNKDDMRYKIFILTLCLLAVFSTTYYLFHIKAHNNKITVFDNASENSSEAEPVKITGKSKKTSAKHIVPIRHSIVSTEQKNAYIRIFLHQLSLNPTRIVEFKYPQWSKATFI